MLPQLIGAARAASNPMAAIQQMAMNNPQMQQVLNYIQQNGGDPQRAFYTRVQQTGVDPNTVFQEMHKYGL